MEELLNEIKNLSKQNMLFPAERIILQKLLDLKKNIPQTLKNKDFQKIINALKGLLSVNKGKLAVQCSSRIGNMIYDIYSMTSKEIKINEVIDTLIKPITSASICACGRLFSAAKGESPLDSKKFVATLLSQTSDLTFSTLIALYEVIGDDASIVDGQANQIFAYLKNAIDSADEEIELMAEKVMASLTSSKIIEKSKFIELISHILEKEPRVFVTENACKILARVIVQSIDPENEEATTKEALKDIMKFPKYKEITFLHFMSMVNIGVINRMFDTISMFILDYIPSMMKMFMNSLTKESKTEMFKFFEDTKDKYIYLLNDIEILDCDDTKFSIAAFAYDLAACDDKTMSEKGLSFFNSLYAKNRQLAIRFLRSSITFLADPPEEFPNLMVHIKAKARIAANIISSVDSKDKILKGYKEYIFKFLNRAFNTENIFDGEFASAFVLMSSLPIEMIPLEDVYEAFRRFRAFFKETVIQTPEMRKKSIYLGSSIAVFIAAHPVISKTDKTICVLLMNPSLISPTTKLAVYLSYPKIQAPPSTRNVITSKIRNDILTIEPKLEYIQYRLKAPMSSKADLLHGGIFIMPRLPSAFLYLYKEDVTIRVVENFAKYVSCIPKDSVSNEIAFLFKSETNKIAAGILIHALLSDKETAALLPEKTIKFLLKRIKRNTNVAHFQLFAESIAMWLSYHPESMDKVLKKIYKRNDRVRCLVYAAMFIYTPLSEAKMLEMMLELNNFAKQKYTCGFSSFALSVLYKHRFQELINLEFIDTQCSFLLDLIQSPLSQDSFDLFQMSQLFNSLLPILSAELETTRSKDLPILALTLQSFKDTRVSFSNQIGYIVTRTANQLAPKLMEYVHLEFTSIKYKSFAERLNMFGVFADMMNFGITKENYFSYIPDVLLLNQITNDSRSFDFIIASVHQLDSVQNVDDSVTEETINNWIYIIKDVLENSYFVIPEEKLHIYASQSTKICILNVARALVKVLKRVTDTEKKEAWLKSLINSTIKPISDHEQMLFHDAFNILISVIDNKCADGFENELALAAEKGFDSLDQCGTFHIKLLDYLIPKLNVDGEKYLPVLQRFVSGIDRIESIPTEFLPIESKLLSLAQTTESVLEIMKPYLNQSVEFLSTKITEIVELMDKFTSSNKEIGELYYSWGPTITGFVWLQTITKVVVDAEIIISFCIDEMKRCNEQWRIKAAAGGIKAVVELMNVSESLITDTSNSLESAQQENGKGNEAIFSDLSQFLSQKGKKQ